jgi:hypothetical protein
MTTLITPKNHTEETSIIPEQSKLKKLANFVTDVVKVSIIPVALIAGFGALGSNWLTILMAKENTFDRNVRLKNTQRGIILGSLVTLGASIFCFKTMKIKTENYYRLKWSLSRKLDPTLFKTPEEIDQYIKDISEKGSQSFSEYVKEFVKTRTSENAKKQLVQGRQKLQQAVEQYKKLALVAGVLISATAMFNSAKLADIFTPSARES